MGIKKQTKTMRINRRDFFMLTIMTPLFAAIVATVLVLGIVMPALKNDKLEVPTLGDTKDSSTKSVTYHIEEYDEDATKKEETKTEQKTEEKPAETQKTETTPTTVKLPTLIKTQSTSQKTTQTQQKQNTNTQNNDAQKKAEEDAKKKAEAEAEAKAQAEKEAAAKAACEARTDGPRTYIRVHFLTSIDRFYASIFSDKEDPIVDYYKASAKEGKSTKMFYQNGACLPSVEDFDIIEDSYLEEVDLEAYGITARTDYEAWI